MGASAANFKEKIMKKPKKKVGNQVEKIKSEYGDTPEYDLHEVEL